MSRIDAAGDEVGANSQDNTDDELDNLRLGEVMLQGRGVAEGSKSVVGVHQGVNKRVEQSGDQTSAGVGSDHKAPHQNDNTSVMVSLQENRITTLQKHNPNEIDIKRDHTANKKAYQVSMNS